MFFCFEVKLSSGHLGTSISFAFRHEDKDMKLKVAEAHLKLGEVGLETEQYETAIEDFKSCLKIQQDFLDAESRLIAETYLFKLDIIE